MKNLYFYLLLVFVLAGCSKGSSNNPTPVNPSNGPAVDYEITVSSGGPFTVTYDDENMNQQTESVNTAIWSKKFNLKAKGATTLGFAIKSVNGSSASGNAVISVNNKQEFSSDFTVNTNQNVVADYYEFDNL